MMIDKAKKHTTTLQNDSATINGLSYFLGHIAGTLEKRELPAYLIDIVNKIGFDYIQSLKRGIKIEIL